MTTEAERECGALWGDFVSSTATTYTLDGLGPMPAPLTEQQYHDALAEALELAGLGPRMPDQSTASNEPAQEERAGKEPRKVVDTGADEGPSSGAVSDPQVSGQTCEECGNDVVVCCCEDCGQCTEVGACLCQGGIR